MVALIAVEDTTFSTKATPLANLNRRLAALRFQHGLSLKEARPEARHRGFTPARFSQRISAPTSTDSGTAAGPITSPSVIPIHSSPFVVYFSSTSQVPSVPSINPFQELNTDTPTSTTLNFTPRPQCTCQRAVKRCSFTSSPNTPTSFLVNRISPTPPLLP